MNLLRLSIVSDHEIKDNMCNVFQKRDWKSVRSEDCRIERVYVELEGCMIGMRGDFMDYTGSVILWIFAWCLLIEKNGLYTYLKVTYCDPDVTYSDPKVAHSAPTHLPLTPPASPETWKHPGH